MFAVNLAEMLKETTIHFFLIDELHKYSLEPKNFLRGLHPLNLLPRGSDPPVQLMLSALPFLLIIFAAGSYDNPEYNKMASD